MSVLVAQRQAQSLADDVSSQMDASLREYETANTIKNLRRDAADWRKQHNIVLSSFGHQCQASCPFFSRGDIMVCGLTNMVHLCGDQCDHQVLTSEAYCCSLTGRVNTLVPYYRV